MTKNMLSVKAEIRAGACGRVRAPRSDSPATYEAYAGTSGSTQGERNETTPAANAVASPSAVASISGSRS
jgi:hypothetical protein